jgi:putative component of toxin-antitoxin plasmid stabilization module
MQAYYFLRQNGRSPLEEYLESINDLRQVAAINALVDKLIQLNGRLPRPYAAHVEGKIWELRTRFGNRVFYFSLDIDAVILLDGYTKKRDRIEPRVLAKIHGLYKEYLMTRNRKPY